MNWLHEERNTTWLRIIGVLAAMPLVSVAHAQTASHYQIVDVQSGVIGHTVILLDTETGDTWTLVPEATSDGKRSGRDAWYVIERNKTLPPLIQSAKPPSK
jgi:hypothetical protein